MSMNLEITKARTLGLQPAQTRQMKTMSIYFIALTEGHGN